MIWFQFDRTELWYPCSSLLLFHLVLGLTVMWGWFTLNPRSHVFVDDYLSRPPILNVSSMQSTGSSFCKVSMYKYLTVFLRRKSKYSFEMLSPKFQLKEEERICMQNSIGIGKLSHCACGNSKKTEVGFFLTCLQFRNSGSCYLLDQVTRQSSRNVIIRLNRKDAMHSSNAHLQSWLDPWGSRLSQSVIFIAACMLELALKRSKLYLETRLN